MNCVCTRCDVVHVHVNGSSDNSLTVVESIFHGCWRCVAYCSDYRGFSAVFLILYSMGDQHLRRRRLSSTVAKKTTFANRTTSQWDPAVTKQSLINTYHILNGLCCILHCATSSKVSLSPLGPLSEQCT